MACVSKSTWIKFFKDAGIPAGIASNYALTFFDNRIQTDMLLDLHKEYLHDMGITVLGDVIAILRHAKRVHEQYKREMNTDSEPKTSESPVVSLATTSESSSSSCSSRSTTPQREETSNTKRSTPASRMLEHYMRKSDDESPNPTKVSDRLGLSSDETLTSDVISNRSSVKRKLVKTKRAIDDDVPRAKKVPRLQPNPDGPYITMATGTRSRIQRILGQKRHLTKRVTVFERLGGEGSVTIKPEVEGPRITITGLGGALVKKKNGDKQSSVFSRLGNKPQVSLSTSSKDLKQDNSVVQKYSLPYAGILKSLPKRNINVINTSMKKKVVTRTMRADMEGQNVSSESSKKPSLQGRLGHWVALRQKLKNEKPNKTAGILANPTNVGKRNIKARLGTSSSDTKRSLPTVTAKRTPVKNFTKNSSASVLLPRTVLRQDIEMQRNPGVFSRLGF